MTPQETAPDPILLAEVERALAPYRALLSADQLATIGEALEHALTTHPVGFALIDRVRPRAAPERSDAQTKEGAQTTRRNKNKRKAK